MDKLHILNANNQVMSLQVSVLKDVPAGNFKPGSPFVVKNLSDEEISLEVRPFNQSNTVVTKLYPGWNPEILAEIIDAPDGILQYGY